MKDAFYRYFLDQKSRVVIFLGGGGKSALIERISEDCRWLNKKTIITSLFDFYTPPEANTLIADDVSLLISQIGKELKKNQVLYIGRSISGDAVKPFKQRELKEILNNIKADHTLIEADSTTRRSMSGFERTRIPANINIDRAVLVIGADALNQVKDAKWIVSGDSFWEENHVLSPLKVAQWYARHEILLKLKHRSTDLTCFINKVENLFLENLTIPMAREIKLAGINTVLWGSIYNSSLQIVR